MIWILLDVYTLISQMEVTDLCKHNHLFVFVTLQRLSREGPFLAVHMSSSEPELFGLYGCQN